MFHSMPAWIQMRYTKIALQIEKGFGISVKNLETWKVLVPSSKSKFKFKSELYENLYKHTIEATDSFSENRMEWMNWMSERTFTFVFFPQMTLVGFVKIRTYWRHYGFQRMRNAASSTVHLTFVWVYHIIHSVNTVNDTVVGAKLLFQLKNKEEIMK